MRWGKGESRGMADEDTEEGATGWGGMCCKEAREGEEGVRKLKREARKARPEGKEGREDRGF